MRNRETKLEGKKGAYSAFFAPEEEVNNEARFPKSVPDNIRQILLTVLIEQKRLVLWGETAKHWNNQKVYETQLKLCADATVMPEIWKLAYGQGEKKLVQIIKALPRIRWHDGTPPMPLSKETKENAQNINKYLNAIIEILKKDERLKSELSCEMNNAFKQHALDTAKSEIEKEHGAYSSCLSSTEKEELKRKWVERWFPTEPSIIIDKEDNTTGITQNPILRNLLANYPLKDKKQKNKIPYIPYDKIMFYKDFPLYHPHADFNRAINNGNTADIQFALAIRSIKQATALPPDSIGIFKKLLADTEYYQSEDYAQSSQEWDKDIKSSYYTSQGTKYEHSPEMNRIAINCAKILLKLYKANKWAKIIKVLSLMDERFTQSIQLKKNHRGYNKDDTKKNEPTYTAMDLRKACTRRGLAIKTTKKRKLPTSKK